MTTPRFSSIRFSSMLAVLALTLSSQFGISATAAKSVKFNFENAELSKIVAAYAKASGQKFVIDPSVRGRATIYAPSDIKLEDAFALMSSALAANQFAISTQDDTMVIASTRNTQRSLLPVVSELPPLKPERLVTMVFRPKNISPDEINRSLRILPSRDGELVPFQDKVIVTDWVSNIHRIARVFSEIDQPGGASHAAASTGTREGDAAAANGENAVPRMLPAKK